MTIAKAYGLTMKSMVNKELDFDTDTMNVALCTDSYTPNQDTHQYIADITNELTGGGYARVSLGSKTVTYTAGTNTLMMDAADVTFPSLTAAIIRYAIFFSTAGSGPLICYMDFEANQAVTAQDFTIVLAVTGIAAMVAA